jgi:hypothetical protein
VKSADIKFGNEQFFDMGTLASRADGLDCPKMSFHTASLLGPTRDCRFVSRHVGIDIAGPTWLRSRRQPHHGLFCVRRWVPDSVRK